MFFLLYWVLMVIAMMLPKLTNPIYSIYTRSFKSTRIPLSITFVFGYLTSWTIAGTILYFVVSWMNELIIIPNVSAIIIFVFAVIWQFSPIKQKCLNFGHNHKVISAFGFKAFKDAFNLGLFHGFWCVSSGWLLMLFPMLLHKGHMEAMIIISLIMLSEHLEKPRIPRWEIRLRTMLFRTIFYQLKLIVRNLV